MHDIFGVASDFIHLEKGYCYPTVPKMLLSERERRASLSEYMRLLYVALTRAEERLYLIGSFSRKKEGGMSGHEDFLTAPLPVRQEKLPPRLVMRSGSFIDFLLLGLARNPAMPVEELITNGADPSVSANMAVIEHRTKDITIRLIDRPSLQSELMTGETATETEVFEGSPEETEAAGSDPMDEEDRKLFEVQTSGVYAYEDLIRMPAKVTVSEMKRRTPPPEEGEDTREDLAAGAGPELAAGAGAEHIAYDLTGAGSGIAGKRAINLTVRAGVRKRADEQALSPTEAGILLHSVFQYLDFSALPEEASPDDVRAELERMVRYNMIRSDQLAHLKKHLSAIADFAASDVCRRMKAAERTPGHGPFREIPFSITEPVSSEDFRLIQGMIDCWFIEDGGAVLIDYKSDRIRGDRAEKTRILKERYTVQLDYYARAIEAASRLKVKEKMIWLIPEATSFAL
jgi:ATP-dependent helicase/nuclease subunit A